jgi:hypothetical protein
VTASFKDWYRRSCYRGDGGPTAVTWSNGSTPTLTITPQSQKVAYVTELLFFAKDGVAFGVADTMDISPWGFASPPTVSIADFLELYAFASWALPRAPIVGSDNYHKLRIDVRPFVRLSDADGDTFTIENSGGSSASFTEELDIVAIYHEVDQDDD